MKATPTNPPNERTERNIWYETRSKFRVSKRSCSYHSNATQEEFAIIMGVSIRKVKSREASDERISIIEALALDAVAALYPRCEVGPDHWHAIMDGAQRLGQMTLPLGHQNDQA